VVSKRLGKFSDAFVMSGVGVMWINIAYYDVWVFFI
jgi:hypothetical protein